MVKQLNLLTLILALYFLLPSFTWSAVQTDINRNNLSINESLQLTIKIDKVVKKSPDFVSLLKPDFNVIDIQSSHQIQIINGKKTTATTWAITLLPLISGKIRIPQLPISDDVSQSFDIVVSDVNEQQFELDENPDIFIKVEIDKESVFIQEQLILTVRLFRSVNLVDTEFPYFDLDDAVKVSIGEQRSYQSKINNTDYLVSEFGYAIFPQKVGKLEIPPIAFSGYIAKQDQRNFFSGFFVQRGDFKRVVSPPISVNVKPIPVGLTKNSTWLPAKKITLIDDWHNLPNTLQIGDSIARTVTIKADGLLASQLPDFRFNAMTHAKVYENKPELDQKIELDGINSTKQQTIAIIPQNPGKLVIPEMELIWWNLATKDWETARLPKKEIEIVAANTSTAILPATSSDNTSENKIDQDAKTPTDKEVNSILYWLLYLFISIAILSTILSIIFWKKSKLSRTIVTTDTDHQVVKQTDSILQRLAEFCHANQAEHVFKLIPDWARTVWNDQTIHHFHDVIRYCETTKRNDDELLHELKQLESHLFGEKPTSSWCGEALLQAIETESQLKKDSHSDSKKSILASLYPS